MCHFLFMNKAKLKSYAPQARKDFIAAVTARANLLGLSDKAGTLEVAPAQTQGDVTVIAGQAWPVKVSGQRDQLIERIRKDGFAQTMEAVAYTWFNRFAALRYMELHDYLGHGHRALSSTSGGLPDILTHATDLTNELPGLNAAKVTELKLAGNRDGELYRMLLVAQCNALSRAMPFLFERIDDDSELLLPDNLLRSDSVIAKLVERSRKKTGPRSKSSAGCTSSTSVRRRTRSLARSSKAKTSRRHPALHAQLDRAIPGAKQRGPPVAHGQPAKYLGERVAVLHHPRRANARGASPARCPHPDPRAGRRRHPQPRIHHRAGPGLWQRPHPGGGL
jgi:hypothetical protein